MALLELRSISARYGSIVAVRDIDLSVNQGEIVTLIGANGAGKTTVMKTIAGLLKCSEGTIEFRGERLDSLPGHRRVKRGVVLVPEGREIFSPLTVDENLLMGGYTLGSRSEFEDNREKVFQLFPRLKERRLQRAGTMSGGEQQMLAIGRALMAKPDLLMLDEPSLGLSPKYVEVIFSIITQINELGVSILLVEQNASMALAISHRGYVLETGRIVLTGQSKQMLDNEGVREAYLGA